MSSDGAREGLPREHLWAKFIGVHLFFLLFFVRRREVRSGGRGGATFGSVGLRSHGAKGGVSSAPVVHF